MLADLEEFRKNPDICFDYSLPKLMEKDSTDEPTQVVPAGSFTRSRKPAENQYRPVRQKDSGISVPLIIGGVAVLLVVIFYFLYSFFLKDLFMPAAEYSVPNLVGESITEVLANREKYKPFVIVETERVSNAEAEEGKIVSQSPEAGKTARGNFEIDVTVSSGQTYVQVPSVENMEYRTAKIALENLGLLVENEYQNSDTATKNYVISSTPPGGTKLKHGDTVTIVISLGPDIQLVTVPSFIGLTESVAREQLKALSLNLRERHDGFQFQSAERPGCFAKCCGNNAGFLRNHYRPAGFFRPARRWRRSDAVHVLRR